jgi:hypothetical protein
VNYLLLPHQEGAICSKSLPTSSPNSPIAAPTCREILNLPKVKEGRRGLVGRPLKLLSSPLFDHQESVRNCGHFAVETVRDPRRRSCPRREDRHQDSDRYRFAAFVSGEPSGRADQTAVQYEADRYAGRGNHHLKKRCPTPSAISGPGFFIWGGVAGATAVRP